jgi:hypothetical protein
MISTIDRQLRFAIANRRVIELHYQGSTRAFEPHDYGVKNGTVSLLAFQLRSSDPSKRSGWKLLHVAKISECSVLDETFKGSRGASHQKHHVWDVLYARVT